MNYFENISDKNDLHWMREIFEAKNSYTKLIKSLDCSDPQKVEELVITLVSKIKKEKQDNGLAEIFLLLSELTTNKHASICTDAMLYCEECPESSIDYEIFQRFLVNPKNYE